MFLPRKHASLNLSESLNYHQGFIKRCQAILANLSAVLGRIIQFDVFRELDVNVRIFDLNNCVNH